VSVESTLDIDAGNSRIKWRLRLGERLTSGAFAHSGRIDLLDRLPAASPERVRVANVASFGRSEALRDALQGRYGVAPLFAKTRRACGGVTCGYTDPSRFGVDRWMAIVAARQLTADAFAVADLGTAATLDFVNGAGLHLGGYIVPGVQSMVDALFRRTADVQVRFEYPQCLQPGANTPDAVNRGVLAMLCAFIEIFTNRFEQDHRVGRASLFVSGGDADVVSPHLQRPHTVVPDLVLDGLSIAIP
jgi:type III pantothenate kinase